MPTRRRGQIVLAEVTDSQGRNPKKRPLVIVTATEEIREGEPFIGVAVSSTFPQPVPHDYVELPFHPAGQSGTRLRKRSAAVCSWLERLTHAQVIRDIGHVPDQHMLAILEKVRQLDTPPPPETAAD